MYFDSSVLSWRAVFERWCVGRASRETATLSNYLSHVMEPILDFVLVKAGLVCTSECVGVFV